MALKVYLGYIQLWAFFPWAARVCCRMERFIEHANMAVSLLKVVDFSDVM